MSRFSTLFYTENPISKIFRYRISGLENFVFKNASLNFFSVKAPGLGLYDFYVYEFARQIFV